LHCVYSGVSVDCFNKDYHHQRFLRYGDLLVENRKLFSTLS